MKRANNRPLTCRPEKLVGSRKSQTGGARPLPTIRLFVPGSGIGAGGIKCAPRLPTPGQCAEVAQVCARAIFYGTRVSLRDHYRCSVRDR